LRSKWIDERTRLARRSAKHEDGNGEDCRGVICEADEAGQYGIAPPQTLF